MVEAVVAASDGVGDGFTAVGIDDFGEAVGGIEGICDVAVVGEEDVGGAVEAVVGEGGELAFAVGIVMEVAVEVIQRIGFILMAHWVGGVQ